MPSKWESFLLDSFGEDAAERRRRERERERNLSFSERLDRSMASSRALARQRRGVERGGVVEPPEPDYEEDPLPGQGLARKLGPIMPAAAVYGELPGKLVRKAPGRFFRATFKGLPGLVDPFGSPSIAKLTEESREEIAEFDRAGQEYLRTADPGRKGDIFRKALAKSMVEVGGYAAQGAVTGPPAAAAARPLAGLGVRGAARLGLPRVSRFLSRHGKTLGTGVATAAEEAVLESAEGGRPGLAAAIGGTLGLGFGRAGGIASRLRRASKTKKKIQAGRERRAVRTDDAQFREELRQEQDAEVEGPDYEFEPVDLDTMEDTVRGKAKTIADDPDIATLSEAELEAELVGDYLGPERRVKDIGKEEPGFYERRKRESFWVGLTGRESRVKAGDMFAKTRFAVVDIDDTIPSHDKFLKANENYSIEGLQNRLVTPDEKQVAEAKIQNIYNKTNPPELGDSPLAAHGAPIVLQRGDHITGNHRWMALKRLYDDGHANGQAYKDWLIANAREFGIDPELVAAFDSPMLVRVLDQPIKIEDAVRFAEESNVRTTSALSGAARATQDAARVKPGTWSLFDINKDADITSAGNRQFVKQFASDSGIRPEELDEFYVGGSITTDGVKRIRSAMLARAYGDPELVQLFMASTDPGAKNVARALTDAAPVIAKIESLIDVGARQSVSLREHVGDAVAKLHELRQAGDSVGRYLDRQMGLEGSRPQDQLSPEAIEILRFFGENSRRPAQMRDTLIRYGELVDKAGDPGQGGLFDAAEEVSTLDVWKRAVKEHGRAQEELRFASGAEAPAGTSGFADAGLELVIDAIRQALQGGIQRGSKIPVPEPVRNAFRWITRYFGGGGEMRLVRSARHGIERGPWVEALPKEEGMRLKERRSLSEADAAAHMYRHGVNVAKLTHAIDGWAKEAKKRGQPLLQEDMYESVLDAVEKNDYVDLPGPVREPALAMREHIDELTRGLLGTNMLTKELRKTLIDNMEHYVRRGVWGVHASPAEWRKIVTETESWRWDNMRSLMMDVHHSDVVHKYNGDTELAFTEGLSDAQQGRIEGMMFGMLDRSPELFVAGGVKTVIPKKGLKWMTRRKKTYLVEVGKKGSSIYRERLFVNEADAKKYATQQRGSGQRVNFREQDLPAAIDDFLGLSKDPRDRVGDSIAHMSHDLATHKFLVETMDDLYQSGLVVLDEPTRALSSPIRHSRFTEPLSGLGKHKWFTTPEIAAVINGLEQNTGAKGTLLNLVYKTNGAIRMGKTAGSIQTHFRNLISWIPMLMAGGHFIASVRAPKAGLMIAAGALPENGKFWNTMRWSTGLIDSVTGTSLRDDLNAARVNWEKLYEKGIRLGVLQESVRAREAFEPLELYSARIRAGAKHIMGDKLAPVWEKGAKGVKKIEKLYSSEDDIGKMLAWTAEANNYSKALGMTFEEALDHTAPLVRDLYPTYSKATEGIKWLRDFPLVADFPTFWAEVVRTTKNQAMQGAREIAEGARTDNKTLMAIGAKRHAGMMFSFMLPAGMAYYYKQRSGTTDAELEVAREAGPPWQRNADIAIVDKKGPGEYRVIDLSYSFPNAVLRKPFVAFMRSMQHGEAAAEGAYDAAVEFLDPFIGGSMMWQATKELGTNRLQATNEAIYHPDAKIEQQLRDVVSYLSKRVSPGTWGSFRRIWYAGGFEFSGGPPAGTEDPMTGRTYDLNDELTATGLGHPMAIARDPRYAEILPGARVVNISVYKSTFFDGRRLDKSIQDVRRRWRREIGSSLTATEKLGKLKSHRETLANAQRELMQTLAVYRKAGDIDFDRIQAALKRSQLSAELQENLLLGISTDTLLDDIEPKEREEF